MQGEVAVAIAPALNAKLSGAGEQAAVANRPTQNAAAFEAYLRGPSLMRATSTRCRAQADAYANAVRIDPSFALAWAQPAVNEGYLYFNGIDPDRFTAESVKHATDMAVQLQPDLAEVHLARATIATACCVISRAPGRQLEAALKPNTPNNV